MKFTRQQNLIAWALFCILAGAALIVFTGMSVSAGQGLLMPLDDAYIHFQYAHQISVGQPYIYNPGLPPTSGATSFLYPYLLAIGDFIGFNGQTLGAWAMGIGALALALCAWLMFRLGEAVNTPFWVALAFGLCFQLAGVFLWHSFSGMETMLAALFLLWLFYALITDRFWQAIGAAALCAVIRPEGAFPAVLGVGVLAWREVADTEPMPLYKRLRTSLRQNSRHWLAFLIPFAAIALQPIVNRVLTGSFVASGNAAKSLFGMIPFELSVVTGRIIENFSRMWREFFSASELFIYVAPALFVLAVIGILALWSARRRAVAVWVVLTLLGGTLAISTLDTAFWHFKRYQIPLIALLWALALIGAVFLAQLISRRFSPRFAKWAYAGIIPLVVLTSIRMVNFLPAYSANVSYIAEQPYQMALWLRENAPQDAIVAVHDVGEMRYFGERTTLDMVGLTTLGAADYWRNGPGAVGELLDAQRPDLIASYGEGHGLGLGYLADTDLYADALAEYRVDYDPAVNVALAAPLQGIYQADYAAADNATTVHALPDITPYLNNMTLVDTVDVADILSEQAHDYAWHNDEDPDGFPSEYYQFDTLGCNVNCNVMDGGRRINGEETFTLDTQAGQDLILVTRLHPANVGSYAVYVNDTLIAERVIPSLPGAWLEVPTLIPAEFVTEQTVIRIVPLTAGNSYMPYTHWAYQGDYAPQTFDESPVTSFQDGAIVLQSVETELTDRRLDLTLTWAQPADTPLPKGDYKLFVHVVDQDGNIVAQADTRPGSGALPPGNLLPGAFTDALTIDLTEAANGDYQLMIGLYDPITNERLMPLNGDEYGRFLLGTIELN